MRDRDIAAALAAEDLEGLAAAYDRYAAGLYGYCRSLLGAPSDAADAVQDTLIIAVADLGGLRGPGRLRPWLYAVARSECRNRLAAGAWPARREPGSEMTDAALLDEAVDEAAGTGQDELRDLVRDAMSRLDPDEREVAELSRWHTLDNADLASVLGVPVSQAHALAARTRESLDRSLGTLLVAATGWGECAGLDTLLDGWDGRPTAAWRTRAGRHVDGCGVCDERRGMLLSPAMLLSLLPLALLPDGLREHVLWLVANSDAEAVDYRDEVISRAGPFDAAGFPIQIASAGWAEQAGRTGRRRGFGLPLRRGADRPVLRGRMVAAALVILAGGGGIATFGLSGGGPGRARAASVATLAPFAVPRSPAPGTSASSGPPIATRPARLARTSPPPRSSPPRSPAPSSAPPATTPPATAPPGPSYSPKPTPSPSPPVLSESPRTVMMVQSATNTWTGSFTLTAANAPISFTISAPDGLTVSEKGGTVRPGSPVTISLTHIYQMDAFPSSLSVNGITVSLNFQL
ncbi:MAG: RNA polymerase sigma factor [Streptosporangiaceae bacterium]